MKHLILDCGGVLVYPRLGDWTLPFSMARVLGARAGDLYTSKCLLAHRQCAAWLDEARPMKDVEDERRVRRAYIRAMDAQMDWRLSEEEIERLGDDFTDNIDRYGFFADAQPWLARWRAKGLSLAVLSDAMPSILGFMERAGLTQYLDAAVISTQVGAIKPDAKMYGAILEKLGTEAGNCLFVDDKAENLEGAVAFGMRAVQMARPETLPARLWDGPVVRDFEGLNRFIGKDGANP